MTDWPEHYPKIEDLQLVIDETPNGVYVLEAIYPMIWEHLGSVNDFGKKFKKAVLHGAFRDITYNKTDGKNHAVYTIYHPQ